MSEHHEKHTIFGPFPDPDPLDTARLFLRTNRYQVIREQTGAPPDGLEYDPSMFDDASSPDEAENENEDKHETESNGEVPDEILLEVEGERGDRWSGFTSSNMADLQTTITLRLVANSVVVNYAVNTTGQFLTEDERQFWAREVKALEAFISGGDLITVFSDESVRASQARRELIMRGLWMAAIVFVLMFVAGIILVRV